MARFGIDPRLLMYGILDQAAVFQPPLNRSFPLSAGLLSRTRFL